MRAYLDRRDPEHLIVIVAKGNAGVSTYTATSAYSTQTLTLPEDVAPGVYRAKVAPLAVFHRGVWSPSALTVGRPVEAVAEADRLQEKADNADLWAHTRSPGIQGYDQRGQASQEAQRCNQRRNHKLAEALRELP